MRRDNKRWLPDLFRSPCLSTRKPPQAPAGAPPAIGNSLNAAVNKVVALPEVPAHFKADPLQTALPGHFIKADYRAWRNEVKTQNLQIA